MKAVIWRLIYMGLREKSYILTLEMVVIECIFLGGGGSIIETDVKGKYY